MAAHSAAVVAQEGATIYSHRGATAVNPPSPPFSAVVGDNALRKLQRPVRNVDAAASPS